METHSCSCNDQHRRHHSPNCSCLWTSYARLEPSGCFSHLILAEEILLPEGEQDDVSKVSWVFDADVLGSVLQHSRRLVDDPARTEERQQQAARRPGHVHTHIHCHVGVGVAGESDSEELWHFLYDANMPMPVAALIPHQHQRHDLTCHTSVQEIGRAAFLELISICGALRTTEVDQNS